MIATKSESDIIEKLNAAPTVRGFFIAAVEVITESVDTLIQQVFRKDEFAVQTVVKPLLKESGPLGGLTDRLKLLFGIGVLTSDIYHDIEDIINVQTRLSQDARDYDFTDPQVISSLKGLRLVNSMGSVPVDLPEPDDQLSQEFYEIQHQRQYETVKSALSLAIVSICFELDKCNTL